MTERYYVLTEERRRQFEEMLSWFQQNRTRLGSANFEEQEYLTPETYLARTPTSGIPAMSGITPGSAVCNVYRLLPVVGTLQKIDGLTFPVYNFSDVTITGSVFVLITREKFGVWAVAQQFEDSVPGTGTGTGGDTGGGTTTFSGARVYHDTTQNFSGTGATFLSFNSERYDTDGYHSNVTNNGRLTIPSDGKYEVGCNIYVVPTARTSLYNVDIYHNRGATISGIGKDTLSLHDGATILDNINFRAACISMPWECLAGDYFRVAVGEQNLLGGTCNVQAGSATVAYASDFWVHKLG